MELPSQFWEIYMQLYDLWVGRLHPYRELHKELIREAGVRSMGTVLDLGCGTGNLALALLEHGHRGRIIGLDKAAQARKIANAKIRDRDRVTFDEVDLDTVDLRIFRHLDAVFCVNVLYALADPHRLIKQFPSILAVGGVVAISTLSHPNLQNIINAHEAWLATASDDVREQDAKLAWARRLMIEMNMMIAEASKGGNFHAWSQEDLDSALEAVGLQVFYRNPQAYAGTAVISLARKVV